MADRPLAKIGIRPDIGASAATDAVDEARLDGRSASIIGPWSAIISIQCEHLKSEQ
jgi:hypothetical protein